MMLIRKKAIGYAGVKTFFELSFVLCVLQINIFTSYLLKAIKMLEDKEQKIISTIFPRLCNNW